MTWRRDADLGGRRVLVTGARGFIGRHLVRHLLDAGAAIHAAARPGTVPRSGPVTWHGVDLADADAVEATMRAGAPDLVCHLAGRADGRRDPELVAPMLEDNVRASVNVMASAQRRGCRVLLAGSIEEPRCPEEVPSSPYAASKAAVTAHARMFHEQWDLPVIVLRPTMTYGPDQPDTAKLVPSVVTAMLAGTEPRIGGGTRLVDWIHVDDVCRAFLAAAREEVAPGAVVEVGTGVATSIAETVRLLGDLTGYSGPLGFGAVDDRRRDEARIADPATAATVLGWRPGIPLETGMARTVEWYRQRAGTPRPVTARADAVGRMR